MRTLNNERDHRVHSHNAEAIKVRGRERSKVAAGDPFAFSSSSFAAHTLANIFSRRDGRQEARRARKDRSVPLGDYSINDIDRYSRRSACNFLQGRE